VPADSSSPIPSGLTVLGHADRLQPAETPHLIADLAAVTDPRARTGRRHPLVAILGWPLLQCWPVRGRSPPSPRGPSTRPSPCVPRLGPAAIPSSAAEPSPPRPRSAGRWPASTPRPWRCDWRVAFRSRRPRPAQAGGCGRRQDPARRPPPIRRPPAPPARRDGPRHPRGAGPTLGRRCPGVRCPPCSPCWRAGPCVRCRSRPRGPGRVTVWCCGRVSAVARPPGARGRCGCPARGPRRRAVGRPGRGTAGGSRPAGRRR
jgi:hypothetical protein